MPLPESVFDYEARLAACARGERLALRDLYVQEGPRLLGVAKRLVRDTALAEDIVHEAFISGTAVESGTGFIRVVGWTLIPNLGGEMPESRIAVRIVMPTAVAEVLSRQINSVTTRTGR